MVKAVIRLGDVFSVDLGDRTKKYFQYVATDLTQLNSQVIRAFSKKYLMADAPALRDVVDGQIEFHAHVVIRWGIQMNLWQKVGTVKEIRPVNMQFRDSSDYTNPEVGSVRKLFVWTVNEPTRKVGRLEGDDRHAEIGLVVSPLDILHRMRTGKYGFGYPGY